MFFQRTRWAPNPNYRLGTLKDAYARTKNYVKYGSQTTVPTELLVQILLNKRSKKQKHYLSNSNNKDLKAEPNLPIRSTYGIRDLS